ncbi:HAD family hydrolase [Geomonas sp. RF6]|uniref:HAD family hydrolase n=1 Tax=Geomonas sp. RF6 TaxID=2897342 RepID=UPI001E43D0A7|nr:HAD family hydrolase [Geomonas sp. RF6]UFS69230.1 HAD family hydrolase [Geomonas sp. RF6]
MVALSEIAARSSWIFDLDGTLTVAVHDFAAIRRALEIPAGADILGHLGSLCEEESASRYRQLELMEEELCVQTMAATGALSLFQLLRRRGVRLGVVTRNTRRNALRTLEHIGLGAYFHAGDILGREEALAKPHPDGIFRLASRWGVAASETVMVGDYRFDLEAGRAAGAATVHVDVSGAFPWPELTDVAVGSLGELALLIG